MSRVSDALERAAEERARLMPNNAADERLDRSDTAIHRTFDSEPAAVPGPIARPELCSGPKPWPERIEEFLLGWGLGRFKTHPLVALEEGSAAAEQYKILREQFRKMCGEANARILALTSPIKGDGKTTVAANLAAAIALDHEEKVLLVDADLRNPSIHNYFGVKPAPGLAEYLSSNSRTDLMSYVQDSFLPGVRILPAGKPSAHSSELLASEKMRSLLREIPVKLPGHQVIIDTSPILSTPDPLVLARHVDGMIMVIRARKTPRDCVSRAIKSLGSNKVLGVVLNDVELGMASRYYQLKAS